MRRPEVRVRVKIRVRVRVRERERGRLMVEWSSRLRPKKMRGERCVPMKGEWCVPLRLSLLLFWLFTIVSSLWGL